MLSSLPVRRSAIVRARYAWGGLVCVASVTLWAVTGQLLAPLLAPHRGGPGMWVSLEGWLTFLVVSGAFLALFLPLYFRLGFGWGVVTFAGLAAGLMVAGAALPPALGAGPRPLFVRDAGGWIRPPSLPIRSAVSSLLAWLGPVGGGILLLLALSGVMALSAWLSMRAFESRDL